MREPTRSPVGVLRAPGVVWAALVFVACLIATLAAWYTTKSAVDARARVQFDFAAAKLVDSIRERVNSYSQVLWGGVGLFAASADVTREQWRVYVNALNIEQRLPGIQGIGYAKVIRPQDKDAHIAEIRAQGFAQYTIWPEGERDIVTAIIYLEPFDWRNQRAFGYDMFTEPVRRAAMQRARDTGQASVSGKVTLVQETEEDVQAGFLMYVPVYRPGAAISTLEQRRAAFIGYVYSPFRVNDMIRLGGLARQAADAGLALEIYDGTDAREDALLFRSQDTAEAQWNGAHGGMITESVGEQPWTFRFTALPSFTSGIDWQRPLVVLLSGLVISLLAGSVVGILVSKRAQAIEVNRRLSVEVARQEQAERRLRQSEAKFRSLFSGNPLPTFAYDAQTLAFIEVNDATVAKYGYSRAEFETMRITDLRPFEDVPRLLEHLSGGQGRRTGRRVSEWRHMTKDGQIIDVEVTADDMELSGRLMTQTVIQDITARKKAQEALVESERMARGIVDTALDAFVQMDESGTIIDWNAQAEQMFGWTREEAIGKPLGNLIVPPIHRDRHRDGLARFLRTGEGPVLGTRFETEAMRRDGRQFRVELAVTALRRRTGHVFNGFIRDLTEKTIAEEQLRQSQKMDAVGQLTGGIAHDFNNILTVITGTIEILAEGVADRPKLAAIARMIDEAAMRGAELTQGLLAFARKQPLQPREVDVNVLVGDTAKLLRPTLGEQIEIEARLESEAWRALVDPNQLSTALINLSLNARDAMPGGGKLTLETGNVFLDESYARMNPDIRPGAYVMIAVSDTGSGIPAALITKVFEPFFTTKETGKGTGLGLSMVYGFVKQSGGHIKIYSEEGHGTSIKIYLPRTGEDAAAAAEAAPAPSPERGHETILVVEDDPLVRNYVVAQLTSLGYATISAGNANEALRAIDEGAQFDLLFTDVIMPGGLNGRQLADEVFKRRGAIKVLYTSGYTEDAIIHHGRLDPGVALLNKPYRKMDLARKVREVLDGAQAA